MGKTLQISTIAAQLIDVQPQSVGMETILCYYVDNTTTMHKIFFILLLLSATLFYFIPSDTFAIGIPFGGRILNTIPCFWGWHITVGPPRPAILIWPPIPLAYGWHVTPSPALIGVQSLGAYLPVPAACVCPWYNCEAPPIPANGVIFGFARLGIGTSLR